MTDNEIMTDEQRAVVAVLSVENANLKICCSDQKAEIEKLENIVRLANKTIERQDAEIERLQNENFGLGTERDALLECMDTAVTEAKSEAIREFWERLRKEADFISGGDYGFSFEIREDVAVDIIKEMVGDSDA